MELLFDVGWAVGRMLPFIAPVMIVVYKQPRRRFFAARLVCCLAIMTAFFYVFEPDADLTSGIALSPGEFLATALYFAAILVLNMCTVLVCFRTRAGVAAFCAAVGYSLENLGASLSLLACLIVGVPAPAPVSLHTVMLTEAFWCAVAYAGFITLAMRDKNELSLSNVPSASAFAHVFGVILMNIVFDMVVKQLYGHDLPLWYAIVLRLAVIAVCVYALALEHEVLFRRRAEEEAEALERLLQAREAQYELSRDTIDAINIKMHDIRHQIRHLEDGPGRATVLDKDVLIDIAREVNVYDTRVKTGNDALDTILTEKRLLGEREGISMSCIADGDALSFMAPADLYALFGNAIENAFEAVRQVDDPERRNISVLVKRVANMASIHIENYYEGPLTLVNGIPATSKPDAENHGFGTKSMRLICERYGGTFAIDATDTTFAVNMLIPLP